MDKATICRSAPLFWKAIGLILSDSILSHIIRGGGSIYFRGMTKYTMKAVMKTFKPILGEVYPIGKNGYYTLAFSSRTIDKERIHCLELLISTTRRIIDNPYVLENLGIEEKASLLAGLIDGDGYIGNSGSYIAISYNANTYKGKVIELFLNLIDREGLIKIGKYRGSPHYERTITFIDMYFLQKVVEFIYIPYKFKRLKRKMNNIAKMRECNLSTREIYELLRRSKNIYVDQRKNRNSKMLVIYLGIDQKEYLEKLAEREGVPRAITSSNRLIFKIAEKCKSKLAEIYYDDMTYPLQPAKRAKIAGFLDHNV